MLDFKKPVTSSMVFASGVWTLVSGAAATVSFTMMVSAASMFALKSHASQIASESSPIGVSSMNSCATLPPIIPVSDATVMTSGMPARLKIRL